MGEAVKSHGKVLLVGEDSALMRLIADKLMSRDFSVNLAAAPSEAVALAKQLDADVMVLNTRDMASDGLGILRAIRKFCSGVQVITLSVPGALRFSIEGMKLGVFADLMMPFDPEELVGRITEAYEKSKARKSVGAFRRKLEDMAVSVAFAEAGALETSRRIRKGAPDSTPRKDKEEK